ncbi:MAG TPA: hypothetical protein VGF63_14655 [Solirubrobacteraceae bacterium]|jgi:ferredoxin-like protein FixX
MRSDAIFIGIEVDDAALAEHPELPAHLTQVCPVDIYREAAGGGLQIIAENVDECVLCGLCLDTALGVPAGAVKVLKLYDGGAVLGQ